MNQKVSFVRIGTIMFSLDQILCIGMLDCLSSIRVDFKNSDLDPVFVDFKSKEAADSCFNATNEILCNPWVEQL